MIIAIYTLSILSLLSVLGVGGVVFYNIRLKPKYKIQQRLAIYGVQNTTSPDAPAQGIAGIRQARIQAKLEEIKSISQEKDKKRQLRELLLLSGLQVTPNKFKIILAGTSVGASVVLYPFVGIVGSCVLGLLIFIILPKLLFYIKIKRRQKEFTQQFTGAIDILVRGTRSGLPIGECLSIIGRESPNPVGEIFRDIVEGQKLGLSITELIDRGLERMPTPEFNFFSIVLIIQQKTGGSLADTLEGLSDLLRERKKLSDKIRALSSEAKASAAIIGSLPFFLGIMMTLINKDFLLPLFTETIGNMMLGGGLLWMAIGVFVMSKMIDFDY
ncbi:type II secretion system F family protein [Alphaproteobacteria bacterium]|jgi:tight adherence protein B|nr:type II secretion system F family protein [Alphaproteobacteria bacterium]